jgi:hypothetical protein
MRAAQRLRASRALGERGGAALPLRGHELPVRDLSANVFANPAGFLQGSFLVAAWTDAAPATGKRDKHLVLALGAPHAREPVFEIAALQKLGDRRGDDRSPEAIALLIPLGVDGLELRVEALNPFVEWRLVWTAGTIDIASLLGTTRHNQPPCGGR